MATHIYSYACGHGEGTIKLYGLLSEQEQKLNKLKATSLCPDCVRRSGPVVDIEEAIDQTIDRTMSRFPDAVIKSIVTDGKNCCEIHYDSSERKYGCAFGRANPPNELNQK